MKKEKRETIRILLVDDHPVVLSGLRHSLAGNPRFEIVGEAATGKEAIRKAQETKPAVALMDLSLPDMNGLEVTRVLRTTVPETQVLILTMHKSKEYVLETVRAGAQGYVLKDSPPSDLLQAIDRVYTKGSYFSPSIEQMLLEEVRKPSRKPYSSKNKELSEREVNVLRLIAGGSTSREIASHLRLSVRTIEGYRKSLTKKLKLRTVAELTAYALNEGLLPRK